MMEAEHATIVLFRALTKSSVHSLQIRSASFCKLYTCVFLSARLQLLSLEQKCQHEPSSKNLSRLQLYHRTTLITPGNKALPKYTASMRLISVSPTCCTPQKFSKQIQHKKELKKECTGLCEWLQGWGYMESKNRKANDGIGSFSDGVKTIERKKCFLISHEKRVSFCLQYHHIFKCLFIKCRGHDRLHVGRSWKDWIQFFSKIIEHQFFSNAFRHSVVP